MQGSTSNSSASGFASNWVEESTGAAPTVEAAPGPATTWPVASQEPAAPPPVEWAAPVPVVATESVTQVYAAPVIVPDPIDEIVAATAGFNTEEDTIVDRSHNQINVALYHIETLRQLLPGLSDWSEDRAEAVNSAISAMETALKGRESDDDPYTNLRHTVAVAKKDPRDIDVMIALSDRAKEIEDLLDAHDKYSVGIRNALIDLKPVAVDYVAVPKKRAPARKTTSTRSRATASKSTSAAAEKSATAPASKSTSTAAASKSTSTGTTSRSRKTSTAASS